jgi:hypothetical protein
MTKSAKRKPAAERRRVYIPVTVPFAATPAGETPGIDAWAHCTVWTERMLATLLENRVRGGKWHTLIDKVYGELNLFCSARKVLGKKGAAGVDGQTVDDFAEHDRKELQRLQMQLREGSYAPAAVRRTWIPKPGSTEKRPLGIPTVRDRVVQTALAAVRGWVDAHGLKLHPEKTHIVDVREKSFSFLGYSFRGKLRFPRAKSHRKFVDRIRELTPRKSGDSLELMLQRINRVTRGWFNYFRHCCWNVFEAYDGMIRRRLRRLLLKRHRRNRKRLSPNLRWPNAYFTERGYTSLNASHVRFVQSTGTY